MKTVWIAALLISGLVTPALAADNTTGQTKRNQGIQNRESGQGQTVEHKKAEIIRHIEERITNSQAEKVCVQAAQSHDELRACREKYRPVRLQDGGQQNQPRNQQ
jgi:hypothetical protein